LSCPEYYDTHRLNGGESFWEGNSFWSSKVRAPVLWNSKLHYELRQSRALVRILCNIIHVPGLLIFFFLACLYLSSDLFPSDNPPETLYLYNRTTLIRTLVILIGLVLWVNLLRNLQNYLVLKLPVIG